MMTDFILMYIMQSSVWLYLFFFQVINKYNLKDGPISERRPKHYKLLPTFTIHVPASIARYSVGQAVNITTTFLNS